MRFIKALVMLPLWWGVNVGAALSQLLSALLGGDPDETISSRLGKARARGEKWAVPLCRLLDCVHKDHCAKSAQWDKDEGGRSLAARFREVMGEKT